MYFLCSVANKWKLSSRYEYVELDGNVSAPNLCRKSNANSTVIFELWIQVKRIQFETFACSNLHSFAETTLSSSLHTSYINQRVNAFKRLHKHCYCLYSDCFFQHESLIFVCVHIQLFSLLFVCCSIFSFSDTQFGEWTLLTFFI